MLLTIFLVLVLQMQWFSMWAVDFRWKLNEHIGFGEVWLEFGFKVKDICLVSIKDWVDVLTYLTHFMVQPLDIVRAKLSLFLDNGFSLIRSLYPRRIYTAEMIQEHLDTLTKRRTHNQKNKKKTMTLAHSCFRHFPKTARFGERKSSCRCHP